MKYDPSEIWRDILGYEGLYQVSSIGRVKVLEREKLGPNGSIRRVEETIKNQTKDKDGYFRVTLSKKCKQKRHRVHTILLKAFNGFRPKDGVSRHLDGNNQNNLLENLTWGSPSENSKDRETHRKQRGESHPLKGRSFTEEHRKNLSIAQSKPRGPRGPYKRRSHCKWGHLLTEENSYTRKNEYYDSRECKTCIRSRAKKVRK